MRSVLSRADFIDRPAIGVTLLAMSTTAWRLWAFAVITLFGCGDQCETFDDLASRVVSDAVVCVNGSDLNGEEATLSAANACVDAATSRGGRFAVRDRISGLDTVQYLLLQHESDGAPAPLRSPLRAPSRVAATAVAPPPARPPIAPSRFRPSSPARTITSTPQLPAISGGTLLVTRDGHAAVAADPELDRRSRAPRPMTTSRSRAATPSSTTRRWPAPPATAAPR